MIATIAERINSELRRITFEKSLVPRTCDHSGREGAPPVPDDRSCPACTRDGTTWLKLRMCLACGWVGCCDTSVGRHAAGHFEATGHPLMRSVEPGERWGWCYVDRAYVTDVSDPPPVGSGL